MDLVKGSAVAVGILVGGGLWIALPQPAKVTASAPVSTEVPAFRKTEAPRRPLLRYYYLPDCAGCDGARALLADLASEVHSDCVSALDEPSEAVIEREFIPAGHDHGALFLDASGKTAWRLPGHDFDKGAIEEGIARARGKERSR